MEQEQQIEVPNETLDNTPEAVVPSLRDTINKARDEVKTKEIDDKPEKKSVKTSDKQVKEKPIKTKDVSSNVPHETKEIEVKQESEIKMPQSLPSALSAQWKDVPKEFQKAWDKREKDVAVELAREGEHRVFGKELREIIGPYMPIIKAEGGTPQKAIQELLNTAYLLRTASPQQKGQLIWQVARQFGADMSNPQTQAQVNPQFQQITQEVNSLKSELQREREAKKQQEDAAIQSQIKTFSEDESHPHFETVKAHMASLLQSGLAKDLQDAYDQAVYANPHTRSALLQQNETAEKEKRVAEQKARAEAAKKAGSSIKGAPGMGALKNGKIIQPDLRSELKAAFAAHREG